MDHDMWLRRIDSEKDQIIDLCRRIVQIRSENPPGDTQDLVKFIVSFLRKKGLDCQVHAPQSHMPNVVARIQGKEKGKRLVFNGHLDTYPAGDPGLWKRNPFSGDLEDGKIFGRGVSDMKGGDTASLVTFLYLAENQHRMKGEVVLTLVSDEETGGKWGICWLLEHVSEVLGDAVLNGEPSSCDLVNFAEKGQIWLEVVSRGKAAHGAYTHLGSNAIQNLYHFLSDLEKLEDLNVAPDEISKVLREGRKVVDELRGPGATDVLGRVTVNMGTISGGLKLNLVPDLCRAEVDIRPPQGATTSSLLSQIEAIRSRYQGIECRILQRIEPNHTLLDQEIVRLTLKNAEAVRAHRVFPSSGIGATDCRHFRLRGIPCSVYGPRSYQMGAPDEFITIRDLMDTVKVHTLTSFDFLEWLD
jgi:succinyl-diaminopimelate desuccinylase